MPLTALELLAIEGLADGLTYKQIAAARGRSVSTIRSQLHVIYRKLGVVDRAQAVMACQREGWIDAPNMDPTSTLTLRLARVTEELCALVRARSKLTDAQREYLSARSAGLRPHGDDKIRARQAMQHALNGVLDGPACLTGRAASATSWSSS